MGTDVHNTRYRLPSEDDDAFISDSFSHINSPHARPTTSNDYRGLKRSRLSSDDDVFFRPKARLIGDVTPNFPKARLPSDSDCSSMFYPRHRRFRGRENQLLPLPPTVDSSSIQLNSSQYTADDTVDPAFKTPSCRPTRHRSSEMSSVQPNSSRDNSHQMYQLPPRVTRTPFAWISPNISNPYIVPMSEDSIADVRQHLFHKRHPFSSVSDLSFSLPDHIPGTSTPAAASATSSPKDDSLNLAHSILTEELKSDSGISSLPSYDGQVCFSEYRQNFSEKLVEVMVQILDKVDPPKSPFPDHHPPCHMPLPPSLDLFSSPAPLETVTSSRILSSDSPPDVLVYPVHTSASSPRDTPALHVASHQWSSHHISPSIIPFAPTPTTSPVDVSAADDLLSILPLLNSSQFPSSAPTPAPSPIDTSLQQVSTSSTKESTQCKVCDKLLHSVKGLKLHMRVHTSESIRKSTQCKECNKVLSSLQGLRTHMRVHTGERPFVCPFCFKDFSDSSTLRRHKRIHIGKPHSCGFCYRQFSTRFELHRHERKHRQFMEH